MLQDNRRLKMSFFLSFSSLDSAIESDGDEEAGEINNIAFEEFKERYKITLFHISGYYCFYIACSIQLLETLGKMERRNVIQLPRR